MLGEVCWRTSTSASGLHAARWQLAGAPAADPKLQAGPLADAVAQFAAGVAETLRPLAIAPARFFDHAVPLAAHSDSPAQIVQVALSKLLGPRPAGHQAELALVHQLETFWAALGAANFAPLDELELRSQPLREQWEARGPGLLAGLERLCERGFVTPAADVILVQPVLGGSGFAHPLYNAVSLEAVLTNPVVELPEIVRLAWLWGALHLDLPKYHELTAARVDQGQLGMLAVLAPVLAAAQDVELVSFDRRLMDTALEAWQVELAGKSVSADQADRLWDWWTTYAESDTTWPVALAALGPMLGA
jgi:hypothetical protein